MTIKFAWQEKYTEALLEISDEALPRRIDAAEKAIYRRIEELNHAGLGSVDERYAIDDALRGLRVLARSTGQTQRSLKSGGLQNE